MKVSIDWLKDYVDANQDPETLAEMLTLAGAEVEEVTPVGDDFCIELEINSNRPDLLGTMGIAREIAAATGQKIKTPDAGFIEAGEPVESQTSIEVLEPELCPRYTARIIRNVAVKPSPPWLQKRLEAIGLRPINNVVDITNYVLMECGQPLHAFDLDLLKEGRIVVRRARDGETNTAIDGTQCKLNADRLVIADAARPVAIAGVMGGLDTEVTGKTVNILLESAVFDPISVRRSARTLNLMSDSSHRFERTVDPVGCEWASRRAIHLIQQLAGGTVDAGLIDINTIDLSEPTIELRASAIPRVLGTAIEPDEIARILEALDFRIVSSNNGSWTVAVPPFRREVYREIDLIEEIARIWGYDRIPETSGMAIAVGAVSNREKISRHVRDTFVRMGFDETVTTCFASPEDAAALTPWSPKAPIVIRNPLRADESALRASMLPGLLGTRQFNQDRGVARADLFEAARIQWWAEGKGLMEIDAVAAVTDGDFRGIRGVVEVLLDQLGVGDCVQIVPSHHEIFEPGMAAAVITEGDTVGWLGQLSGAVQQKFDLRAPLCFAELNLTLLGDRANLVRTATVPPRFPAVSRDVNIVVDEEVSWQQVTQCIEAVEESTRESVQFIELYRGEQVGPGRKSLVFSVTYRSPDGTLTNDEVNASHAVLIEALETSLQAKLRS